MFSIYFTQKSDKKWNRQKIKFHVLYNFIRIQNIMAQSKSPKKDGAQQFDADPEMKQRARRASANRSRKQQSVLEKYSYHIVMGIIAAIMVGALIHSLWKSGPNVQTTDVNSQQYIKQRNYFGSTFEVGSVQYFNGFKLIDVKNILNTQASNKQQLYLCNNGNKDTIVPETYNFREEYPKCARQIANQRNCSASYSFATVGAITDRWCRNNDLSYPVLSAQQPLACDKAINNHCRGGYVSRTLDYAKIYGIVDQTCLSFNDTLQSPEQCKKQTASCQKHKIADYCVSKQQQNIKQQIFNNGPVITVIPVYRDFLIYKTGIYRVYPKNQKFSTGQAVKIIGWDVRDGQTCWLVENSWGENWGENGIACILVNQDELQIEKFTIAPALNTQAIGQQQEFSQQNIQQTQTEHEQL